jgi:radical SAM protein with 4Fe4S-binding SPASM domain
MCPYHEIETREAFSVKSEMEFSTLKNIVASFPNDPHYSFDMSSIGETLLFKPLPDFIAYMKKEKPLVNTIISTNALPLTEGVFRRLIEAGLDNIQLSLYAQNAEDHAHITGTDSYERVAENVRKAGELKKKLGTRKPFLQTFIFDTHENKEKIPKFIEQWSQYVDKCFVRPVGNVGRSINGLTPVWEKPLPKLRYPCLQPWYSTSVDSKGDIHACRTMQWRKGVYDIIIGNINEKSLREMWDGEIFKNLRVAHLKMLLDDYPVCQTCDSWASYTNIWNQDRLGRWIYKGIRLKDFFKDASGYRGG